MKTMMGEMTVGCTNYVHLEPYVALEKKSYFKSVVSNDYGCASYLSYWPVIFLEFSNGCIYIPWALGCLGK